MDSKLAFRVVPVGWGSQWMQGRGLWSTEMEGLLDRRLEAGCEGRRCVLCPTGGVCGALSYL